MLKLGGLVLGLVARECAGQIFQAEPVENLFGDACVEGFDDGLGFDFFPDKSNVGDKFLATVSPDYSLLWNVSYHGTYKVLTDASHKQHVLYLCGTPAPSADGFAANASFWRVPISKVATTSTTYLPFLEMIGERGSLAAYASSFEYVTSACALKLHRDGDVAEAYDSASYSMDNAMLEDLGVELTIADMWSASAHNAFVMSDTQEDSVLKIAEYVELVALFFNREAEATAAITSMVENYMCAKASAAELAAAAEPVKVLWSTEWNGGWSIAACPSWYCEIVEAAGGAVLEASEYGMEGEVTIWGTTYLSTAQVAELALNADVWIVPGAFDSSFAANFSHVPAVSNGRLFDYQGVNGANDWFERRVVEPDTVLQDVAQALYPTSALFADHQRKWLRDVTTEAASDTTLLSSDLDASCPDVTADYAYGSMTSCAAEVVMGDDLDDHNDHDHTEANATTTESSAAQPRHGLTTGAAALALAVALFGLR